MSVTVFASAYAVDFRYGGRKSFGNLHCGKVRVKVKNLSAVTAKKMSVDIGACIKSRLLFFDGYRFDNPLG